MKLIYIPRKEMIFFYFGKIDNVRRTQRYGGIYYDYISIFPHKYCFFWGGRNKSASKVSK